MGGFFTRYLFNSNIRLGSGMHSTGWDSGSSAGCSGLVVGASASN